MQKILNVAGVVLRRLNGFVAVVLALFVVLVIGLQGGVVWLNTDKGNAWISDHINAGLADSGYSVFLDGFRLSGFIGIGARSVELRQNGGVIASGEVVALSVNPFPIGVKQLAVKLRVESLSLLALPVSEMAAGAGADSEAVAINALPDLYFSGARVRVLIDRLNVSENIVDGGFSAGVDVRQKVGISSAALSVRGRVKLRDVQHSQADFIPLLIQNAAVFDVGTQEITVENVAVSQGRYRADLSGRHNLGHRRFNAELDGEWLALGDVSADLGGPIQVRATIGGGIEAFDGEVLFSTVYKDVETTLRADVERDAAHILLRDIVGAGGPFNLTGEIDYDLNAALAVGEIDGGLSDLALLDQFVGDLGLIGRAKGRVRLFANDNNQAAFISADIQDAAYQGISVQSIKSEVDVKDVRAVEDLTAGITVLGASVGEITLEKARVKLSPDKGKYAVEVSGNGYSYNPFSFTAGTSVDVANPMDIERFIATLKTGGGTVSVSGGITLDALAIKINSQDITLGKMAFVDLSSLPIVMDRLSGDVTGSLSVPKIQASYSFHPLNADQYDASFQVESVYESGLLTNVLSGSGKGITAFDGRVDIPFLLSLQPFQLDVKDTSPITGRVDIRSDLGALSGLFLDEGYTVSGALSADAGISGSLSSPLINGSAKLNNAAFFDSYNDIQFVDVNGAARFDDRLIEVLNLSAKDVEKTGGVTIKSSIDLTDMALPDIDGSMQMSNMHIIQNDNYDAWLNADIAFDTKADGYLISGTLSPQEVSIRIPDKFDQTIPQLNIVDIGAQQKPTDTFFKKTRLDIQFSADNKIFVSGRGLDAEFEGDLDVTGNLAAPLVKGSLSTIRGRFEEFGRRFALDKAELRFQGAIPPSPYLDIEASTIVDDITAKVLISSSIEDPQIKLEASPTLPEDEIISLILFGKNIQNISPFQAIKLANTLRRLSGKGGAGFDPLQQLQDVTGLDDIRVDGVGTDDATIGAGKYISDKVYLEVEQGTAAASGSVSVEVEVAPNISIESKAAQNGESDIGAFWEWNY